MESGFLGGKKGESLFFTLLIEQQIWCASVRRQDLLHLVLAQYAHGIVVALEPLLSRRAGRVVVLRRRRRRQRRDACRREGRTEEPLGCATRRLHRFLVRATLWTVKLSFAAT